VSLVAGQKVGPYEIIEKAGAGGMGEIYKANDPRLNRTVAIKVLPSNIAASPELKERFEREAKAISSLNHAHICTLYDIGNEDGVDYLVMEFLEGETLAERLSRGPIPYEDMLQLSIQIASGLDAAHHKGLIHRDLKPGNIMLTGEGAKLLDFGLAKLQLNQADKSISAITQTTPLTGANTILGTMQYMAPEQLEGKEADVRSDIFAFGAIMYEMATGKRAFQGSSNATLIASIIGQEPISISTVIPATPPLFERLVKKCLSKEPRKRWQSVSDLSDELRWIAQGGSQIGLPAQIAAKRRFKFGLARVIGAAAILSTAVFAYLFYAEKSKAEPVIKSTILPDQGSELGTFASGGVVISPMADRIAFVARDTTESNVKLWVRPLNSITAIPLKGTEDASFPFWSHDGEYLAFFAKGKLKKILSTGGPVLTICDASQGRSGDWNRDDIIVFTPDYKGPLFMVPAAGGEAVQLTTLDSTQNEFTHRYVTFLPDHDHFLFFNRRESNSGGEKDNICISSISNPTIVHLLFAKSNPVYANGQLLFMRDDILMTQQFDASALELKGSARPLAENVSYDKPFSRGVFDASDNGCLIYRKGVVSSGSQMVIYDTERNVKDTIGEMDEYRGYNLSHDNRYVAFELEDRQTGQSDIWIYDLERSIRRRFTFSSENDWAPSWSPNDSQIVFGSSRDDMMALYIQDVYSTEAPQRIMGGDPAQSGVLSPGQITADGKYLVVNQQGPQSNWDIMLYEWGSKDGMADSVYLRTEFTEGATRVSPDGRWMAYGSNESGTFEVYVSTFPRHSAKWQVSNNGGLFPKWSPDGSRIYYKDFDGMVNVVDVDGSGGSLKVGKLRPLQKIGDGPFPWFHVFRDEKRLLVIENAVQNKIDEMILVQNWPAQIQR
jgi:eukaryotic-like serine/threonine-protein kinase